MLIWVSLIGIAFFLHFGQDPVEPPYPWDWRAIEDAPFTEVAVAEPARLQPVRLLGRGPQALYGVEALHALGLLGVAAGGPPSHANGRTEVLVVPSERCSGAAALQAHLDAGGAVVLLAPCPALRVSLDVPEPVPWQVPAPEASSDPAPGRRARNLPLPPLGHEWIKPPAWESLVRRVDGGVVVMQRGKLVATSVDLVSWLRALRQGEADYANVDRDGQHGLKPNDLRPFPWSRLAWRQPSADIWTELLAWIVGDRLQARPLPRAWPLPGGVRSALILTVDQDFAPETWIDPMLARTESVNGELSLLTTMGTRQTNDAPLDGDGGTLLPAADLTRARQWGHGIGAHPHTIGLEDPKQAAQAIALHTQRLEEHAPRVVRHHFLRWWGHDAPVEHLASLGYWMELNFVSLAPEMRGPGFQFGSGRPLRWQVPSGAMLPILSQPTQIEDDVIGGDLAYSAGLTWEQAALASNHLLDHGRTWGVPITANVHPLLFAGHGGVLLDGLLAGATERSLPVISAERWATWSWVRLKAVGSAPLSPGPKGWNVGAQPAEVPLQVWTPGEDCDAPTPASPLSGPGCLTPWGG